MHSILRTIRYTRCLIIFYDNGEHNYLLLLHELSWNQTQTGKMTHCHNIESRIRFSGLTQRYLQSTFVSPVHYIYSASSCNILYTSISLYIKENNVVIPMGEIKPETVKFLDILNTDISECRFRTCNIYFICFQKNPTWI